MLKSVLVISLLLVSQVFAGRKHGQPCTESDLDPVCDSSGTLVLVCESYFDMISQQIYYKWAAAEQCDYCCELNKYPYAYCTDSRQKCLEDQRCQTGDMTFKKIYNLFRRE